LPAAKRPPKSGAREAPLVSAARAPKTRRLAHETRVTLLSLAAGAPAVIVALVFLWGTPHPARIRLTLTVVVLGAWAGLTGAMRERVVRPLQTLSNMMAALREGDYSIRARGAATGNPLGLAFYEVNALADALRRQRLDAREATGLLRQVMESIDVAVFAFDDAGRLRLLNPRGEALLGLPAERALGSEARALGLTPALAAESPSMIELALPGRSGRWEVRRGNYRWEGRPHELVVLSDLTRPLREEERLAWQRLIRVLSHEINNSLAPIQSIAGSLQGYLAREAASGGLASEASGAASGGATEIAQGLAVIEARAEALGRFLHAYARLARLPKPQPRPLDVTSWARRAASLETRVPVAVRGGPGAVLVADGDQMEALLTNLVRNAADAALETGGGASIGWDTSNGWLTVSVEDDGPGISDTSNLFVPFFTTKSEGTGIGLALSRQIAEAHGGSVTLANRDDARGCVATVMLPLEGVKG
jgi:two-component system nitrogen regulation sensor histidine kinase NtrY